MSQPMSDPVQSIDRALDHMEYSLKRQWPRLRDSPRSDRVRRRLDSLGLRRRDSWESDGSRGSSQGRSTREESGGIGDERDDPDDEPEPRDDEPGDEIDQLDDEGSDGPVVVPVKKTAEMKAVDFAQKILGAAGGAPNPISMALQLVVSNEPAVGMAQEVEALKRLVKGYQCFAESDWPTWVSVLGVCALSLIPFQRNTLRPYRPSSQTIANQCNEWVRHSSVTSHEERLRRQHTVSRPHSPPLTTL
jgi:hypothetical protein